MSKRDNYFKILILFTFASWFGVVTLTDTLDFLVVTGFLDQSFSMKSCNYYLIQAFLNTYDLGQPFLIKLIYLSIILAALFITICFLTAIARFKNNQGDDNCAYIGFWSSIALMSVFLGAAELFLQYDSGHILMDRIFHMLIGYHIYDRLIEKSKAH